MESSQQNNPEDTRASTGIAGLDDILGGGFSPDRIYLVQGEPGVGKTTLAFQFLLEGVKRGEKVFYITMSETQDELLEMVRSHGWSMNGIDLYGLLPTYLTTSLSEASCGVLGCRDEDIQL